MRHMLMRSTDVEPSSLSSRVASRQGQLLAGKVRIASHQERSVVRNTSKRPPVFLVK